MLYHHNILVVRIRLYTLSVVGQWLVAFSFLVKFGLFSAALNTIKKKTLKT